MIEVITPGPLTTVQDLGRVGYAALGVSPSGAADLPALMLANQLVDNPAHAAGLEVTLGGLVLQFRTNAVVAVTGARCEVRIGRLPVVMGQPVRVPAGERLALGKATSGVRTYIAVRGGVAVPPLLGSRSTDVLGGLGPPPLARGQLLPLAGADRDASVPDRVPLTPYPVEPSLEFVPGPRTDWFDIDSLDRLCSQPYVVSSDANRVGLRLVGPALNRSVGRELPSEGLVRGAVQVPPSGQPVIFLADHPTTGGYPVIAVVRRRDLSLAAQLRPGQRVRFWCANDVG